jgi:glycosyltransferase involved in cell wall biosynthesis
MNILFTCNEYPPEPHGGHGTFVQEISRELIRLKHKVYVYGIYKSINTREVTDDNGVVIIKDPANQNNRVKLIYSIFKFGRNVDELCKKFKIDVVEAHDTGGYFLFINFQTLFVRLHSSNIYFKKRHFLTILLERLSFRIRPANIIAVSRFIKLEFKNYFQNLNENSTITVIHNGFEYAETTGHVLNRSSVVFAGTFKPIKGINDLLVAYLESELFHKGVTLDLYGKDILFNGVSYIKSLIENNKDVKELFSNDFIRIHKTKPKKELLDIFANSLMCVFPSLAESFGLVVIESMSTGAITIYTDQGAAREIIEDGECAFLVKPNSPTELSLMMKNVYSMSAETKEKTSSNAIEKARSFSIERCAAATLEQYFKKLPSSYSLN